MTENIKKLYDMMTPKLKGEAIVYLAEEFQLSDVKQIEQKWILESNIPEAYQEKTVQLFQRLIRTQTSLRKPLGHTTP